MMSTNKLGDDYLRVPRLDVLGSNWIIYKDRLRFAADARGYLAHLDNSKKAPVHPTEPVPLPSSPAPTSETVATLAAKIMAYEEAMVRFEKEDAVWRCGEGIVKQLIAGTIPDSLFIKVWTRTSAYEMWSTLSSKFQNKLRMVSVNLHRRLQDARCGEKEDLWTHFTKLHLMCKTLAAMGHPPTNDDFYAIILGSLPFSYKPYVSAITATSSVLGTMLSAEDLMLTLTEEHERHALCSKGVRCKDNGDAAFYSTDKAKGKSRRNVKCFNCKKKGHYKSDCWVSGGGKEDQGPKARGKDSKESAAIAKDGQSLTESAWMAICNESAWQSDWKTIEATSL